MTGLLASLGEFARSSLSPLHRVCDYHPRRTIFVVLSPVHQPGQIGSSTCVANHPWTRHIALLPRFAMVSAPPRGGRHREAGVVVLRCWWYLRRGGVCLRIMFSH